MITIHFLSAIPYVHFIGQIIFGGFFLYTGVSHIMHFKGLAGFVASKDVPSPVIATGGAVALLVVGGALVMLNIYTRIGLVLLVLFMIPVTVLIHDFWNETDPAKRREGIIHFGKNMGLLGALLLLL